MIKSTKGRIKDVCLWKRKEALQMKRKMGGDRAGETKKDRRAYKE